MKKMIWLALLLPMLAFADSKQPTLITTVEVLGPVPTACDLGHFGGAQGVEKAPDGKTIWVAFPQPILPLQTSIPFSIPKIGACFTDSAAVRCDWANGNAATTLYVARGFPSQIAATACMVGLIEANRI